MVDSRMGDDAQELIDAWPRYSPGKGTFRKFPEEPPSNLVMRTRADLRIDEDVRVDRTHWSPSIHEIEELVAIENINPGLELSLPAP